MALGLQQIYFFMHQDDEAHTPHLCKYFVAKVNAELDVPMKEPEFLEG
jgi:hypothetical protein